MAVKFVYFDLGNVLLRFCHERMLRQVSRVTGLELELARRVIFAEDTGEAFDRGEITRQVFYDRFCTATSTAPDFALFEDALSDIFEPIPESFALARELLAQGMPCGILSNTNASHWDFARARFAEYWPRFDVYALSFELKTVKPQRRIYELSAALANTPPEQIVFFDDRPENIAGAIDAGWDAVLFESPEQARGELVARGIVLPR